ncbi:hypothetical protein SLS53_006581 [Cytospora paraplurivora]|uniref:Phenazine biosynthesis protein n=1 Tax=Cytospora paraplurivora TaxID=2898453 RepID=A0AAN9U294_9PEZI
MHFITLDVFTDTPFLGNPLAVVIVEARERDGLDRARKQLIAREFNLSETAFLYLRPGETLQRPDRSSSARELGIFTTEQELPFAGHPTIGTAYFLLRHLGWDFVDTIVPRAGPIRITKTTTDGGSGGGGVLASIPHDVHLHSRTLRSLLQAQQQKKQQQQQQGDDDSEGEEEEGIAARIQASLHDDSDIRDAELDAPAVSIVKGMAFVLVELPSLGHLGRVRAGRRPGPPPASLLDEGPWADGFVGRYYFVRGGGGGGGRRTEEAVRARLVAPSLEDPATGSAASALASYLSLRGEADEVRYRVTQGVEMGRKSDIEVNVVSGAGGDGGRVIKEVRLGGTATVVMKGEIQVPA